MNSQPVSCDKTCFCVLKHHQASLVVVTGGPGAGKTAILEMAKKNFCRHVVVIPESASLIFKGGFWRMDTVLAKSAAQRAIFHVQSELEGLAVQDGRWGMALCDRGTLDGLAYWPSSEETFWDQVGSGPASELIRYKAVIHLRTPSDAEGYNQQNELRIESSKEAQIIDERISAIWSKHPRYIQIPSSVDFLTKAKLALNAIEAELPSCCYPAN